MVTRVSATPEALEWIARLAAKHGALLFHQSGGCCDGSAPMCYPDGELIVGDGDMLLGHIGATPVAMPAVDASSHRVSIGVASAAAPAKANDGKSDTKAVMALLSKNTCTACHGIDKKIVGPGFNEIAKKYPGKVDYLAGKIKAGGAGVWGPIPMPAQNIGEADAKIIANWIAAGATK